VIDVIDELVVIGYVRRRAGLLGAEVIGKRAVAHALRCLEGGASAVEACTEGERFLGSWTRHPSRPGHRTKRRQPAVRHLEVAS
jgi:hypothetical protein